MATHVRTKLYTEIMSEFLGIYECHLCMARYQAEVAQSLTTIHIYEFVPPVRGLPSSVEVQTSDTRASTSVVFAPGLRHCTLTVAFHMLHNVDLCELSALI